MNPNYGIIGVLEIALNIGSFPSPLTVKNLPSAFVLLSSPGSLKSQADLENKWTLIEIL